ncbi:excisionase family protein [Salmonella enterica subsp. enterica serovar Abony]|nr:excisionase [Salmonella enterica subsp. enterica serovar Napoli]EAA6342412.1 excisionase [Salmonella enterica subsp. enterica serovar Veneziana]EAP0942964.1 excisionase [Salmonella enterica]EBX9480994.1 excisionase [Salmonella enterica subsp. enterica serovar Abony]ECA3870666.1 excisionase [Salmonella enterica subsp. enterica serovar Bispebjerg]ECE6263074.1 excisionase [Salmonella enterica subsp. enterica]ECW0264939.1 excisionase [Salmonella enterica subsp. diarizonae]MKM01341.1 excisiona
MGDVIQLVPSKWVCLDLLIASTGMKKGTILRARRESWLLGREYKHVAPDGHPVPTSECMYNREAIDRWVENLPSPDFDL